METSAAVNLHPLLHGVDCLHLKKGTLRILWQRVTFLTGTSWKGREASTPFPLISGHAHALWRRGNPRSAFAHFSYGRWRDKLYIPLLIQRDICKTIYIRWTKQAKEEQRYSELSGEWRSGAGRQRVEGAGSEQNVLSVLLNWNWGGNCRSEASAMSFLMAFLPPRPPSYALTMLLNLRGGLVLGGGLQNCQFGFLILYNCP